MRILVVLGYSNGEGDGLHPICAARLARAAALGAGADAVVLTGRREAELMRRAWRGPDLPLICETHARITAENAAEVAALVRRHAAAHVVVVTSWWHRPRASLLFRALLRGTGARLTMASAGRPWSPRLLARELACFALLPLQVRRARLAVAPAVEAEEAP